MSISNLQDVNNGFDLKCRSVTTLIPLPGSGDVTGPASSQNGYIATYDGVTGKVIKADSTVGASANRIQAFDGFGLPAVLEINSDTDHLGSDITNVGSIGCNSVNTDIIAAFAGSEVVFNNKPQSNAPPTVDSDLTNKLYVDTKVGNFFAGLSDSGLVSGTTLGSLAPLTGDGTLTIPANGFNVGDSFHLVCAGNGVFSAAGGNTVTVRLLSNASVLGSIVVDMENANPTHWELESDFTIRSVGATGRIAVNFDFTYQRPAPSFDFRGGRQVQISNINTTIANTLDVDAQFSVNGQMTASLFYLKKMH